MSMKPTGPILVVESDRDLGETIAEQLAADGYAVELARNVRHARILACESRPKLAVIGELDSSDGALRLLEEIREADGSEPSWDRALPTIVIGSRTRELDVLRAFEIGADDFLSRSAGYLELRARLRAILRRSIQTTERPRLLEVGALAIDTHAHAVTLGDRAVELRRMEYELLVHLARAPERVFTKDDLLRAIWRYRSSGSTRTLDSHASRLRRKLNVDDPHRWVINVWGVGYRLIQ